MIYCASVFGFFCKDPAAPGIYTFLHPRSRHDALPICAGPGATLIQLCSAPGPIWVEGPHKASHHEDAQHAEQWAVCPVGAALAALPLLSEPAVAVVPVATITQRFAARAPPPRIAYASPGAPLGARAPDRKSTRLNYSH